MKAMGDCSNFLTPDEHCDLPLAREKNEIRCCPACNSVCIRTVLQGGLVMPCLHLR